MQAIYSAEETIEIEIPCPLQDGTLQDRKKQLTDAFSIIEKSNALEIKYLVIQQEDFRARKTSNRAPTYPDPIPKSLCSLNRLELLDLTISGSKSY